MVADGCRRANLTTAVGFLQLEARAPELRLLLGGRPRMVDVLLLAGVAMSIISVGCASPAPTTVRISVEQARAEFGMLAVSTVDGIPGVHLGRPVTSHGKAAARGAKSAAIGTLLVAAEAVQGGRELGVIVGAVIIAVTPITTIAGTIYGALAAKSPEQVERAAKILETAGQATEVQYHLRDLVIAQLDHEHFGRVVALGGAGNPKPPVDSIVEVWISSIALLGEGINPRLTLHLSGGMRLLRGGVEKGYLPLSIEGQKHTLLEWADDDAKVFKAQILDESEKLAEEVVITLLSRPIPSLEPRYPTPEAQPANVRCPGTSVWNGYGCTSQ